MTDPVKPAGNQPDETGSLPKVLEVIAKRLTSQPMLFGLGVLVLLAIAAATLHDRLDVFVVAALVIFVFASGIWFTLELVKARVARRESAHGKPDAGGLRPGVNVDVAAQRVGEKGSVVGIEGLPTSVGAPDVRVAGTNVEGKVSGVRYAPASEGTDDNRRPDSIK